MNPDSCYLKKRKQFVTTAEDLGLPAPKHICCETTVRSECDSLYMKSADGMDVGFLDSLVESTQDSNSLLGDSQSSISEVIFDSAHLMRKMDSYDGPSTWANSRSLKSRNDNDPHSLESRNMRINGNFSPLEDCQFFSQQNDGSGWYDIDVDGLEECMSANYCKDSKLETADELEDFFSSSGVDTSLFKLSSQWNVDQEAQTGRRKLTIDQEFEQYFSTLML